MDILLVALFGLLLGGVVNALADDLPAGRRLGLPRYPAGSRRPLTAWLGISAFALNLRRAPAVKSPSAAADAGGGQALTWRYPLVELALSILMALTYSAARGRPSLPGEKALIWQALVVLFVLIAVIDIEHRRIPIALMLVTVLVVIFGAVAAGQSSPSIASMLAGALCAGLVFSLVYQGGRLFGYLAARWRRPLAATVFGLGDVYLMTIGGLIVGFPHVLAAMFLAVFTAGILALLLLVRCALTNRQYKAFAILPYGPCILASTFAVLIMNDPISRFFSW
ncbi:MAG: A24 family peptidase [Chloroflexota bacterium]|nr:A24 family peptidase [Chloroflexota bacterium]